MRLKESIDYLPFLKVVEQCSGEVLFHSADGDCLDLKSTFCQYLFASVSRDRSYLSKGRVECVDERDYTLLDPYLE